MNKLRINSTSTYKSRTTKNRVKYRTKIRLGLFEFLSGWPPRCIKCGYLKDWRALNLDHINGHGSKRRKAVGSYFKEMLYYYKHPGEAKKELQVLCANCNRIKQFEELEWPSKDYIKLYDENKL